MIYFLAPFIAWLVAGCMKFVVNYMRFGSEAKERIGNGGFPSNHTTIMVTTVMLIGFREGFDTPSFGLGIAITFIVIIDAMGLRRHVGYHAKSLNEILNRDSQIPYPKKHRESMGHKKIEVLGGIILGSILAFVIFILF
jgi:acid phosphatase family membrane protein YuiD